MYFEFNFFYVLQVEKTVVLKRDHLRASDNPYPKLFRVELSDISRNAEYVVGCLLNYGIMKIYVAITQCMTLIRIKVIFRDEFHTKDKIQLYIAAIGYHRSQPLIPSGPLSCSYF